MAKEIVLEAKKGAPEFIAQGVYDATLEDGHYLTSSRAFADSIIGNGYATEVEEEKEASGESQSEQGENK